MISCTACRTRPFKVASGLGLHKQRWKSYDAASLSREALTQKVEAGLGEGVDGKPLRIDADSKTVATASGSLPLSPVLDPAWIRAKRLTKKLPSLKPGGRFRKKLSNNPYARALETPIRKCVNLGASLPRYFLQDFELVRDPSAKHPCWVHGPMTTKFVLDEADPIGFVNDLDVDPAIDTYEEPGKPGQLSLSPARKFSNHRKRAAATPKRPYGLEMSPNKAPITTYALCRMSFIDLVGGPNKRYATALLRNGMAVTPEARSVKWCDDMGPKLLRLFRRCVVDALISRKDGLSYKRRLYVSLVTSWDFIEFVERRGCVLWVPREPETAPRKYAMFDVQGAQYGNTMAVHNLVWLLGKSELLRLQENAPIFQNELVVLTQENTMGMIRLHLLLWRLQGFLGDGPSPDEGV